MKKNTSFTLKLPWLAFIAGTRAALGFGAGLLLSNKIPKSRRRKLGISLVAIGAATTIPAIKAVRAARRRENEMSSTIPNAPQFSHR